MAGGLGLTRCTGHGVELKALAIADPRSPPRPPRRRPPRFASILLDGGAGLAIRILAVDIAVFIVVVALLDRRCCSVEVVDEVAIRIAAARAHRDGQNGDGRPRAEGRTRMISEVPFKLDSRRPWRRYEVELQCGSDGLAVTGLSRGHPPRRCCSRQSGDTDCSGDGGETRV